MASITRAQVTRSDSETVVRNKVYVLSIPAVVALSAVLAFAVGAGLAHRDAAGGFVAIPLVCGLFNYFYWVFAQHSAIRLTSAGLIVENALMRHEYSWMAAPTVFLGRGLRVSAMGARPVNCQAFADSNGARSSGYEGHRLVLTQIQKERQRIREKFPVSDNENQPPYHWRFQLPAPWLVPAVLAAFAAVYALGLLAGAA